MTLPEDTEADALFEGSGREEKSQHMSLNRFKRMLIKVLILWLPLVACNQDEKVLICVSPTA